MSYKIYIVDVAGDQASSSLQEAASDVIHELSWSNNPDIINVELTNSANWMPPGYLQSQSFGQLAIIYHFEGAVTAEAKESINRFSKTVFDTFRINPILAPLTENHLEKHDAELNKKVTVMQASAGTIKHAKAIKEIQHTTIELEELTRQGTRELYEIGKEAQSAFSKDFLNDIFASANTAPDNAQFTADCTRLEEQVDRQLKLTETKVISKQREVLAKQAPLTAKISQLSIFADKLSNDYRLQQKNDSEKRSEFVARFG